jgi:hypothetical protein
VSERGQLLAAWLVLLGLATPIATFRLQRLPLPRIVLWAWERPEDLRFIDPQQTSVAFLASTLRLRGSEVAVQPRRQPLAVPDGTVLAAVVRVESDSSLPPEMSSQQATAAAAAIAETARLRGVTVVQVDFDARASERAFYRQLLEELRRRLPQSFPISITALASWCLGDNWLDGLPVDEAVPMLFRMGVEGRAISSRLAESGDFRAAQCRDSIGVATDEVLPRLPSGRRLYIFHPQPWSPQAYRAILARR